MRDILVVARCPFATGARHELNSSIITSASLAINIFICHLSYPKKKEQVLIIRLNRPDKFNSFNRAMALELIDPPAESGR
jgi:hypothetical protein